MHHVLILVLHHTPAQFADKACIVFLPAPNQNQIRVYLFQGFTVPSKSSPISDHRLTMTGKAKPKKHTAKEIAAKVDAATTNRGGGKAGQEKGGHAKYECPHCKTTAPDLKTMQIHHDARHPKLPFEEDKLVNLHAALAPDTSKPRPGVRGSLKK